MILHRLETICRWFNSPVQYYRTTAIQPVLYSWTNEPTNQKPHRSDPNNYDCEYNRLTGPVLITMIATTTAEGLRHKQRPRCRRDMTGTELHLHNHKMLLQQGRRGWSSTRGSDRGAVQKDNDPSDLFRAGLVRRVRITPIRLTQHFGSLGLEDDSIKHVIDEILPGKILEQLM